MELAYLNKNGTVITHRGLLLFFSKEPVNGFTKLTITQLSAPAQSWFLRPWEGENILLNPKCPLSSVIRYHLEEQWNLSSRGKGYQRGQAALPS